MFWMPNLLTYFVVEDKVDETPQEADESEQILGKRDPQSAPSKKAEVKDEKNRKKWEDLKLIKPLMKAVRDLGFKYPTNIQ